LAWFAAGYLSPLVFIFFFDLVEDRDDFDEEEDELAVFFPNILTSFNYLDGIINRDFKFLNLIKAHQL